LKTNRIQNVAFITKFQISQITHIISKYHKTPNLHHRAGLRGDTTTHHTTMTTYFLYRHILHHTITLSHHHITPHHHNFFPFFFAQNESFIKINQIEQKSKKKSTQQDSSNFVFFFSHSVEARSAKLRTSSLLIFFPAPSFLQCLVGTVRSF